MKMGAEPGKVAILGVLAVIGGYVFYSNVLSQPSGAPPAATPPAAAPTDTPAPAASTAPGKATAPPIRRAGGRARNSEEFHPSLKPARPEDRPDPSTIDPTLRLDLLAKVQSVDLAGGARSLFQFSTPPPPPLKGNEPKILPKKAGAAANGDPPKPAEPVKAVPPPPPPINLKYYGFSVAKLNGRKTAFFLDGEDILIAAEGETVKRRYKVVSIGVNSVVMQDTESKSEQTLPLQPEVLG